MIRHLALVLSLALLGCDGKSPTEPKPPPTPTAIAAPTATPTPPPTLTPTPGPTATPTPQVPYFIVAAGTVHGDGHLVSGGSVTLRRTPAGFTYIVPISNGIWHCQVFSGDFAVTVDAPGFQRLSTTITISYASIWFPFELYPSVGGSR